MENTTDDPFPHGTVLKKFEGTIYDLGDIQVRPTSIQKEQLEVMGIARHDATFDAENVKKGKPVVLKPRAEPNHVLQSLTLVHRLLPLHDPAHIPRRSPPLPKKALSPGHYTPDCIAHAELVQDDRYEYPAGFLGVLVVSKNPNRTANIAVAISAGELKREELRLLAKGCEDMFRAFREKGLCLGFNTLEMEYEPETMRPYVHEPEHFTEVEEPGQPPLSGLYKMRHIEAIILDRLGEEGRREVFGDAFWQWYWNEGW